MWFLPVMAVMVSSAPASFLPESIRATLDQEYPGWKLAPVTAQVQKEFKTHKPNRFPSLVAGDFDRDGKRDYAVQIALTAPGQEEQIIIVFLARGSGFEENIVQSMGLDPTVYLWVSNRMLKETGSDAQDKLSNRTVLMVLGGPIGDTTYAYQDGKFQEITSEGDPEHPDPSVPRPVTVPGQ
jgi:hypothetical protein